MNPHLHLFAWLTALVLCLHPQLTRAAEPQSSVAHPWLLASQALPPEAAHQQRTSLALTVMQQWLNSDEANDPSPNEACEPGKSVQRACIDAIRTWLDQRALAASTSADSPLNVYKLMNDVIANQLAVLDAIEPHLRRVHPQVRRD